jgi:DNA-directed RNA polymerase subunit RPC12/RpoP
MTEDKVKTDYKCGWCGNKFVEYVAKASVGSAKHNAVSTQVICPKCHSFLPTWEDEEKKPKPTERKRR